jgi:hypothetical protein
MAQQPIAAQSSFVSSANADEIKKLWELKESGAISSQEFELEKNRLLSRP